MSGTDATPDPSQMQGVFRETSAERQELMGSLRAQTAAWRASVEDMEAEEAAHEIEDLAKAAEAKDVRNKLAEVLLASSKLRTAEANELKAMQLRLAGSSASMRTASESAIASKVTCSKVDLALVKQIQADTTTDTVPKLQERATRHGIKR